MSMRITPLTPVRPLPREYPRQQGNPQQHPERHPAPKPQGDGAKKPRPFEDFLIREIVR